MNQPAEIGAVRDCLLADLPPLDAGAFAAARDRAVRPTPPRQRRPRAPGSRRALARIVPLSAMTALAIALAVALGDGGHTAAPGPFEVPSAAAAILNRAAAQLSAEGALHGAQARVIREDMLQLVGGQGHDGKTYYYVLPRTMESGFDGLGNWFYEELPDGRPRFAGPAAKDAYATEVGHYVAVSPKPRLEQHLGVNAPNPDYLNLSARQVETLPTQPAALKTRLLNLAPALAATEDPHSLVALASRLLTFGPTPPAVQAGLVRLLAKLPGVRRSGVARIGGKRADILAFPGGTQLAFARATGQLLEEVDVLDHLSRGYPGVRPGSVVDSIVFTQRVAPTINAAISIPGAAPTESPVAPNSPAATPPPPTTQACRSPLPGYDTDVVIDAVRRTGTSISIELQRIRALCQGRGDFGILPTGPRYTAPLAPGATVELLSRTTQRRRPATVRQLEEALAHLARHGRSHGAPFALKMDQHGRVTGLAELFYP